MSSETDKLKGTNAVAKKERIISPRRAIARQGQLNASLAETGDIANQVLALVNDHTTTIRVEPKTIMEWAEFVNGNLNQLVGAIAAAELIGTAKTDQERTKNRSKLMSYLSGEKKFEIKHKLGKRLPVSTHIPLSKQIHISSLAVESRLASAQIIGNDPHFQNHYLDLLLRIHNLATATEQLASHAAESRGQAIESAHALAANAVHLLAKSTIDLNKFDQNRAVADETSRRFNDLMYGQGVNVLAEQAKIIQIVELYDKVTTLESNQAAALSHDKSAIETNLAWIQPAMLAKMAATDGEKVFVNMTTIADLAFSTIFYGYFTDLATMLQDAAREMNPVIAEFRQKAMEGRRQSFQRVLALREQIDLDLRPSIPDKIGPKIIDSETE